MSKKVIPITDELLDSLPELKAYVIRRLWYAYYRELRVANRVAFEELLRGNGRDPNITGILNSPGVITKNRREG